MDRRTVRVLRTAAAALVFVTAAYHLWWGFPRSLIYLVAADQWLASGIPPDPRPFLFVALGVLLLAGPYSVTRDYLSLRYAYVAGTLLLVGSIAAWVTWHATGHGAFLVDGFSAPGAGDTGHTHGTQSTVGLILSHFDTEPVETAIKTVEATAVAIFVTLLWRDPAVAARDAAVGTERGDAGES